MSHIIDLSPHLPPPPPAKPKRVTPKQVLAEAGKVPLRRVIVIGETRDGKAYLADSHMTGPELTFLMEYAAHTFRRELFEP